MEIMEKKNHGVYNTDTMGFIIQNIITNFIFKDGALSREDTIFRFHIRGTVLVHL